MENQYTCRIDIDHSNGDVEVQFNGDVQEIYFKFMIAFVSILSFFYVLLQLWNGKANKTEIDGFGFTVRYYLTVEEKNLCVERLTFDENAKPIFCNYKFDFERFAKALDKDFLITFKNNGIKEYFLLKLKNILTLYRSK